MNIEVNGKKHEVKFGFGSSRKVVEKYGYNKMSDFDKIIKKLKLDKLKDEPNFEQLEFIGRLVVSGIENANKTAEVSTDDVIDVLISSVDKISEVFTEFQNSLPQNTNPEKRGN